MFFLRCIWKLEEIHHPYDLRLRTTLSFGNELSEVFLDNLRPINTGQEAVFAATKITRIHIQLIINIHIYFFCTLLISNKITFLKYGKTKKIGSIGVERCILPSDLTLSSINQDLLFSSNAKTSCTIRSPGLKTNIAGWLDAGCLSFTTFGKFPSFPSKPSPKSNDRLRNLISISLL